MVSALQLANYRQAVKKSTYEFEMIAKS